MRTNECYVYFALSGARLDPDEVSTALGIQPTRVTLKGERIPGKIPRETSWILSTETVIRELVDVYAMTQSVLEPLRAKAEEVNRITEMYDASACLEVVLTITGDDSQSPPAIGFEAEDVKFLAAVGAYIDIDTYRN